MRKTISSAVLAGMLATFGMVSSSASASFHTWRIVELYSDAAGTVQFIEFQQGPSVFDDERFLNGQSLSESSLAHSYSFPSNLPSAPAASSRFLVATPGYAALGGVPVADYVLPINTWFNRNGDTVTFAGFVDNLTFTGAQMPSDGSLSLKRAYGASAFTTSVNSPTNFAGITGTVPGGVTPEPGTLLAVVAAGGVAGGLRRRRA